MGEIFANPLTELAEYGDMKQDLMKGKGPVQICGVTDSQKVHVMYQVSEEKAWRLVVTHDDTRARELYDDFSYPGPGSFTMTSAILKRIHGCIPPGIFCFTAPISMETF